MYWRSIYLHMLMSCRMAPSVSNCLPSLACRISLLFNKWLYSVSCSGVSLPAKQNKDK